MSATSEVQPPLTGGAGHADSDLDGAARAQLGQLRAAGLHRQMRRVEGRAGPRMRVDGCDALMFAGSNYLDLAGDARVIAAAARALEQCGGAAGGSRLISGNLALHEQLESQLATFSRTEAALLFGSGYLANLGVITALAGAGDVIVSDALNHASIIDACRLSRAETRVFAHNDAQSLADLARSLTGFRRRVLIVDGVYSMDGDVAALGDLVAIARAHDMWVVIDDAHGVGVLGEQGRGAAELAGVVPDVLVGNLAKAFGAYGAYVACSSAVRELLVNTARSFIFTCALPPAAAGAALAGVEIATQEPERRRTVLERSLQLRRELVSAGFDTGASATHIVPLMIGDEARTMLLCEQALARGIYAQGIRYPSVPHGAARIRFTPTAGHTAADISAAARTFAHLALTASA
jgi:8-amino-7-oxononanoate synthase